jgi:DNA-binding MarR family transcriptional regulator
VLTLTPAGRELLAGSHSWQEQVYAELTAGWDPEDAARFAGYLQRLESELP